ncbi:methyl-accepting chemotaxis protein McpN [Butyrivibrio proteoclasticus B316]|uniref:Methyl-accepting chemotaxis protein McpN n=1 Tax=Butyrivibrio proteoclasticus (strain ATCC 51982 / DSM 14932 / B316) TaxID=515622 RepID=E0RW20_BUTPB|nr:methyl-accepting chemotaxis protein [Butyrivibrio proteoclasticus]ADL32886.1 methyl-accepting chemotaxis protein McpN [Butyrivibrio proteoclasticus B316]
MAKESKNQKGKNDISLKNSIKTRLIAVMLLVVAVPLIVSLVISYITSTRKAQTDAETALAWQAKYLAASYEDIIDKNLMVLRSVADNPTTIVYMQGTAGIEDDVMVKMLTAGDNILNDGNVMAIADTTGMQKVRSSGKLVDVKDREYFQEAIKGNIFISNVLTNKTTGARQITMAVPIKDESGNILGEVQRNYNLDELHNFLQAETDDAFIMDRDKLMAAHAKLELGPDDVYDLTGAAYASGDDAGTIIDSTSFESKLIMSWFTDSTTGYRIVVSANYDQAMAAAKTTAMITVVVGIIMLIIASVISLLMANSFTNPIKAVNESLSKLADGRFAKIDKFTQQKDEFGAMVNNTNTVIEKLDDIVTSIKASANDVESSSMELSDMADQISQTAEDVSNAVQEIASGATQQADEIQNASENVGNIGDAVVDVQTSTNDLEGLASRMQEASEASSASLSNLQESSNEMTGKIDEISSTISATQNAVTNINDKVEGISSIATQTNLLSLNASIEAARAGEAGKGFAVVAEEIGKLAEDSKKMADDIRQEMDILLDQSKAAVSAAESIKDSNITQQSALGETLTSVNSMLEDIASTVGGVQRISRGAETCESSKNAVVDTMSALSAISEENAASSEETGASMEELSATVTTLAGSANNLKEIAAKLNEDMSFFK